MIAYSRVSCDWRLCVWMGHREVIERSHRGYTEVTQRDLLHSSSLLLWKWWSYFSMVHKGTQFASVNKLPPMSRHWRYSDWVHSSLEESVWCLIYTHSHCSVSEQETVQTSGILECPSDQAQSSYSGLWWGPQIFSFPSPLVHVWSSPSQNVPLCFKCRSCPLSN